MRSEIRHFCFIAILTKCLRINITITHCRFDFLMAAFLPLPRDSNELILLNVNEDRLNGNFILRGIYIVIVKSNIGALNLVLNNFAVLCIFVKIIK